MVARIAPSPISSSVAAGDALPHAIESASRAQHHQQQHAFEQPGQQPGARFSLPPPSPPGEAFAAAVIAGQLPPRPVTTAELRQRLGSAWQPPASPLRLMDKSA